MIETEDPHVMWMIQAKMQQISPMPNPNQDFKDTKSYTPSSRNLGELGDSRFTNQQPPDSAWSPNQASSLKPPNTAKKSSRKRENTSRDERDSRPERGRAPPHSPRNRFPPVEAPWTSSASTLLRLPSMYDCLRSHAFVGSATAWVANSGAQDSRSVRGAPCGLAFRFLWVMCM